MGGSIYVSWLDGVAARACLESVVFFYVKYVYIYSIYIVYIYSMYICVKFLVVGSYS